MMRSYALYRVFFMDRGERRRRRRRLRAQTRRNDISRWVDSFLSAAFAANLNDFPPLEPAVNYLPEFDSAG